MPEPLALPYETPIDLTDSTKWTLAVSQTFTGESAPNDRYYPIDEQLLTFNFTSPLLIVQTINNQGHRYMGSLSQWQNAGIGGGTPTRLTSRRVWVGTQLIRFRQDLTGLYQLRFKPSQWVKSVSILIWEFL